MIDRNDPHTRLPGRLATLALLAALGWAGATGCDGSNCGPGTHEERGECVPDLPVNCAGPGLEFIDGVCQVSDTVCAAGSIWDGDAGQCMGEVESPVDTGGASDTGGAEDVTPDTAPSVACGDSSPEGTVCVSGVAVNWATGEALTGDEPVGVVLDDLSLRSVQPDKQPFAATGLEAGGAFILDAVPISSDDGPLADMILILDEAPQAPTDDWQRTLTGVPDAASDGAAYPGQTAFAVPSALVSAWDVALGRSDDTSLANVGFLLIRVLSVDGGTPTPVAGATVQNVSPEQDALIERHYLNDDLAGFRDEETTGATGSVLLIGAPVGQYTATRSGVTFRPTIGGSFSSLAVTTVVFGEAQ